MRKERKKPEADIRNYYPLFLQGGLIITLLLFIGAFTVNFSSIKPEANLTEEQEVVKMEEIVQTQQVETPPPPPRPPVPVEVPNDEILEDEVLDLDAELNLDSAIDLPPPPSEPQEDNEDEIFVVVEQQPELIGGMAALQSNIEYPEMARKAGIEGRVFVQFVVDEKGNVNDPKVVRGIGGGCDKEALRAVRSVKFKPGLQRGKPVKVQFSLPVVFQLR